MTAGAVVTLAIALGGPAEQAAAQDSPFAYAGCPVDVPAGEVEGETVDCGYLTVPADHFDPGGPTIELAVAILYGSSDDPEPDAVLWLEGGPGGDAVAGMDLWVDSPILDRRDLILLDQRGTGWSTPLLDCPDEVEFANGAARTEATAACRADLLAEGIDLALFDSLQSAADVEYLRLALGYDAWNLYGASYGTRLALTVMREFPEGVRSAVLDSVYPPQVDTLEELSSNNVAGLETLFDGCAADRVCDAAYPYLEWDFYETMRVLSASPAEVEFSGEDGEPVIEPLVATDFYLTLVGGLNDSTQIPWLPAIIDAAAVGDFDPFARLSDGLLTGADGYARRQLPTEPDGDALGLYLSVECSEEIPFNDPDLARADVASVPLEFQEAADEDVSGLYDDCAVWDVPRAADVEAEPVESDIPTLILAGQFDVATPSAWAWRAAETLPNSFVFEYPGLGHGVGDDECPLAMLLEFLDDPVTEPDSTCIPMMGPPDWVVRGRSWPTWQ